MSSTLSDHFIAAAFWTGFGALFLTLLLGLQIVNLRMRLRRHRRRENRTLEKWRPILSAVAVGEMPPLPPLPLAERLPLMRLWVHLQSSMRGDAQWALNEAARKLGLDTVARAMLPKGALADRLLAIVVLGYLRDDEAWPPLLRIAGENDGALSRNALWALIRIDPQAAAEQMTPFFICEVDWPIVRIATILKEADEHVAKVLLQRLPQLGGEARPRALRLAEALRIPVPSDLLAAALRSGDAPSIVAALRNVNGPETLAEVRPLLEHTDWQVRVQAAKALGRVGDHADLARLATLLQDREWWVRYRAAQALLDLPMVSQAEAETLKATLSDRFAADILTQAMAEKGMA